MIVRNPHSRIPGERWMPPADKITQPEGVIATSMRGSTVNVTVRLRRMYSALLGAEDRGGLHDAAAALHYILWVGDALLKFAVIAFGLFVFSEIVSAFLPGGPAHWIFEASH